MFQEFLNPDFYVIHAVYFFVMGLLFGSFFNVCIYRIPSGQSISLPGSYCYSCGSPVQAMDNIPVISYLVLRGRCRTCRSPFSSRYALIELLTGCIFLAVFVTYGMTWAAVQYCVFSGLLLVATFTDFDHWIIPDRISYGGAAIGIGFALVLPFLPGVKESDWLIGQSGPVEWIDGRWWAPAVNSLVGALSIASVLWTIGFIASLIFRMPAMGLGDSKLLLCIGAFLGWKLGLICIVLASFFGSIQGLFMYIQRFLEPSTPKQMPEETLEAESEIPHDEDGELTPEEDPVAIEPPSDESVVLERMFSGKWDRGKRRHHLKFGPHLALAAWLLMIYAKPVLDFFYSYLGLEYLPD